MKNQLQEPLQEHWRWMRPIVGFLLPRGVRERHLTLLDAQREPPARLALMSASSVAAAYMDQGVAAFNKYGFLAQIALSIFCFGVPAWSLPRSLLVVLVAVLSALALRNAYTYPGKRKNFERYEDYQAKLRPRYRSYLDSAKDGVAASVVLLIAEVLVLKVATSAALPVPVLYRGAVVFLPLMWVLQMVLRPTPDPKAPFEGSELSAEAIYKRTWALTILWFLSFWGLILMDVTDDPYSLVDPLRGGLPIVTVVGWIILQRNGLDRRDSIETWSTDWKTKALNRLKETLAQELKKGEPFYWVAIGMEVLMFLEVAVSLSFGLWPWLSGKDPSLIQPAARITAFGASVLSWRHVKAANYAAVRALQQEIDARKARETAEMNARKSIRPRRKVD